MYFNRWTLLISDHGSVGRSKRLKYGLHHTWEHTWPIGNGSQLKAMCSVATILMNGQTNNCLFQRQPKPSLFISFHTWMQFCKLQTSCCFKFQPGHSLCTRTTLLNIGRVARKFIVYSGCMSRLQQFLCRKPRCRAILEKYRRCRLFLCVAAMYSLATKQVFAFLHDFPAEQSHLWHAWLILLRKCFK